MGRRLPVPVPHAQEALLYGFLHFLWATRLGGVLILFLERHVRGVHLIGDEYLLRMIQRLLLGKVLVRICLGSP